jgi:hypothetical protein
MGFEPTKGRIDPYELQRIRALDRSATPPSLLVLYPSSPYIKLKSSGSNTG